jgi:putative NIF3 family GTP cyclohydrolase 1 type 2
MIRPSRREFVGTLGGSLLVRRPPSGQTAAAGPITAARVAERIRANIGAAWREKTVDGFKAGNPDTLVTGILTTVMATRRVLAHAVELRRNLVITQEPVFYSPNDEPGNRASDPVYAGKKAYIEEHGLVVYRFSDHWNARQPDPRIAALAGELGWPQPDARGVVRIPETSVSNLLTHLRQRLAIRGGLRTVGSPALRVRTVLLSPGTTDVPAVTSTISAVDVVIAGEPREWEVVPYIHDCREAGMNKAVIAVGRAVSEAPGMKACAEWIKPLAPGVPVAAAAFADPYWSPEA